MSGHNSNSNRPISGETAAWYREFIDQASDLVQCVDSEGRFTYVNQAWLKTLKYSSEEVTGLTLWEIIHPDSREHCRTVFEQVITGKAAGEVEAYFVTKDGALVAVEGNVSVKLDEEGHFVHTRGIFRNVSTRKATEKALRESEEKLSSILNNMTDVVWSISWPDFKHLYLSPALEKIYGRPAQEFYANPTLFKEVTHPEDRHLVEKAIEQLQANGEAVRECRIVRPDGSIIWINDRSKMIYDENQQPVRVDGVTSDITERKRLEQALSRSEERFQKMLSLVPDLVSIHDSEMNIVYSNWNGFGAVPEEKRILNTKCYKTYRGLDQICPDCQAVTVLQTGEAFQEEVELPDGMWVDLRIIPILGEDQTIEYFVEWVRDITGRKESEKELTAQHKLLEGIMDNVSDVLSIQYPDHTIERYNRAGYELLGMTPEEVRGKKCHQLIGRERECEECATARALQSGKLEQIERYFPELGIHLNCRTNPVFEDGKVGLLVQQLRDVTERKEVEQDLFMQKERLSNIVEGANVGTWEWNAQTGETRFNERWAEMVGYTLEEISPVSIDTWVKFAHPEDLKESNRELKRHFNGEIDFYNVECRMKHKDGHWIWVNDRGKVISWTEDGKPLWVFGTHVDITDRKETEEALAQQAAERAAVDTFTYSVSNDLQAPLRRIEGFSEMLMEECAGQLDEQARDYLTRIITQIGSMKKITDALLQLSNVVSREIDREEVNLSTLVRSNLEKLQHEEPERQLETVVAPQLIAEGDADLLKILLKNLLDNAWKFTSGLKKTRIEFGSTEQNGRTVYYLKDNGTGFNMSHADKLFIPFHKLHSEEEYPGIGIGLNLVYRIISRHGGEIWAEGKEGKGACFYFTLP